MNETETHSCINELLAKEKVIHWMLDKLSPTHQYLPGRIRHVADLAHELSETAWILADQIEKENNLSADLRNESMEKAGQAGAIVGLMIGNATQKGTKDED